MSKKVIFLDIDGTLTVAGSNVPPESALKAVKASQEKGNYVLLCTGRNEAMLTPLLQYGFDGFIGSAGGYVKVGDEVIFDCPMSEALSEKAIHVLKRNGVYVTIECAHATYTDEGFKKFIEENIQEGGNSELMRWRKQLETALGMLPLSQYRGEPVYKIVIMAPDIECINRCRADLEGEFLFCIQDQDRFGIVNGEIINRQFNKGTGVEKVCEYLGLSIEDSIGYGDSMNDLEMIEKVGYSVVMANGSETLKQLADETCPSVEEDGLFQSFKANNLI